MTEAEAIMGPIGHMLKESRAAMIAVATDDLTKRWSHEFDLRIGDYIGYVRERLDQAIPVVGRIIAVNDLYQNSNGGMTSQVQVMPLLSGGNIGATRIVVIVRDKGAKCLRQPNGYYIQRMVDPNTQRVPLVRKRAHNGRFV